MPGQRSRLSRSESLHHQVARNLRNDIAAGVLRDGQPLPTTRDLAEQWGVSVFTISEAMKLLTNEGLIVSKPRAGRVVNAPDQLRRDRDPAQHTTRRVDRGVRRKREDRSPADPRP